MFDVLVIGGGAAGLMAALTAGQRGRSVAVLEHGPEVGRKILISGGGRCNFTNQTMRADRFLSANPHFVKSAISRYQPGHFIELLAKHRIAWHEKKLGQLFCDNSAHDIVQILLNECAAAHVRILTDVRVYDVGKSDVFRVQTSRGDMTARSVVLATGGLSIPKLGASRFTYEMARPVGLAVIQPEPALVPLTFGGESDEWVRALAGLSLPVRVTCGKTTFEEALLFTHRGLSGPALLQISSYWSAGQPLFVDFLPGQDLAGLLLKLKKEGSKAKGAGALARWLPQRLAHAMVELGAPERTLAEWADRDIRLMAERVHRMELKPQGTEGFAKAEVTRGGVDTRGLSSRSMEAQGVPGLYVVGEAVDVTGWLGGYNFHWAWASGHAAGEVAGTT